MTLQVLYGVVLSESKFKQIEMLHDLQSPNIISVMTDSLYLTEKMVDYAKHSAATKGFKWNIFLKLDSGTKRAGFDITDSRTPEQRKELLKTVELITANPEYCSLHGVYQYSNECYTIGVEEIKQIFEAERQLLIKSLDEIRGECGVEIPIVSSGSTPACLCVDNFEGITEIHPGNYVFYDMMQYEFGVVDDLDSIPISVMSRIIGRYPHRNELLIDCGSIGLSLDRNVDGNIGYGAIVDHPNLKVFKLSQEVGKITTPDGSPIAFEDERLQYGSVLRLLPHHSCLMAAQYPFYYMVNDKEKVLDVYHKVGAW